MRRMPSRALWTEQRTATNGAQTKENTNRKKEKDPKSGVNYSNEHALFHRLKGRTEQNQSTKRGMNRKAHPPCYKEGAAAALAAVAALAAGGGESDPCCAPSVACLCLSDAKRAST